MNLYYFILFKKKNKMFITFVRNKLYNLHEDLYLMIKTEK